MKKNTCLLRPAEQLTKERLARQAAQQDAKEAEILKTVVDLIEAAHAANKTQVHAERMADAVTEKLRQAGYIVTAHDASRITGDCVYTIDWEVTRPMCNTLFPKPSAGEINALREIQRQQRHLPTLNYTAWPTSVRQTTRANLVGHGWIEVVKAEPTTHERRRGTGRTSYVQTFHTTVVFVRLSPSGEGVLAAHG